jgi:hypothetical protein
MSRYRSQSRLERGKAMCGDNNNETTSGRRQSPRSKSDTSLTAAFGTVASKCKVVHRTLLSWRILCNWRTLLHSLRNIIHKVYFASADLKYPIGFCNLRFEVFRVLTMKDAIFWDGRPCGSCKNRRSGGIYSLHHQGDKIPWTRNNVSSN